MLTVINGIHLGRLVDSQYRRTYIRMGYELRRSELLESQSERNFSYNLGFSQIHKYVRSGDDEQAERLNLNSNSALLERVNCGRTIQNIIYAMSIKAKAALRKRETYEGDIRLISNEIRERDISFHIVQ